MDCQRGLSAWTVSVDCQRGLPAWTVSVDCQCRFEFVLIDLSVRFFAGLCDGTSAAASSTSTILFAAVGATAVTQQFRKVTRSDDGFVSFGDVAGDRFRHRVNGAEEVHHERPAVKQLVDVQQNGLRLGLGESGLARFHGFSFVAFEASEQ